MNVEVGDIVKVKKKKGYYKGKVIEIIEGRFAKVLINNKHVLPFAVSDCIVYFKHHWTSIRGPRGAV